MREGRSGDDALLQRVPPEFLETAGLLLLLPPVAPVLADNFQPRAFRRFAERRQYLVSGAAGIQRRDERLKDAGGAVVGASITPTFEIMRLRYVPIAQPGRLVLVQSEMDSQRR